MIRRKPNLISNDIEDNISNLNSAFNTERDIINDIVSDNSTLLSDALTDGSSTINGVSYSLSRNTLTVANTATGNSLYAWIAMRAVPSWFKGGNKYIVNVKSSASITGNPQLLVIDIKTTSNTSTHTLFIAQEEGAYIVDVPSDITHLKISTIVFRDMAINGTITAEISNAIELKDLQDEINNINGANLPSDVTELSSFLENGSYHINSSSFSNIIDFPSGITSLGGDAVLINHTFNNETVQFIYQPLNGVMVQRHKYSSASSNWASLNYAQSLIRITDVDADNIVLNGFYVWGSNDSAKHVPYTAGTLIHIGRDNNTKYQICISYYDGSLYIRQCKSGSWGAWDRITEKKQFIKYESGSFANGKATERISIYLPATIGYIMYRLYHFVDDTNNCNGWQIFSVSTTNDSLGNNVEFTVSGEWECAIHLDGRDDFSGGHTHGDEVKDAITVLLNGVPVDYTSLTSNTEFDKIQIVQTSVMYDPADHTTEIADHGKEYVFENGFLTLNQSLKWKVAESLTNCFMGMFLPQKTRINSAYANNDFNILSLESSSYSITKNNATAVTMYNNTGGISADVSVSTYPSGLQGGDRVIFTDNGGLSYNKLYFKVCESGNSAIGELWKSTTIYKIDNKT